MILVNGNILPSEAIDDILPTLEKRVCITLQKPIPDPMIVVEACHQLAKRIEKGLYEELLKELIDNGHVTAQQILDVICLFKKESLLYKLKLELGRNPEHTPLAPPYHEKSSIYRKRIPLGVLLHISAGNVDGLPAYSIIEGLLAGNINILKLPSADHGFTLKLLYELIQLEPSLAEFIYVFDTPSSDIKSMKAMAECADAIVVWGGDAAIEAVRRLAAPNTKIIEWGHKISFAYLTAKGMKDESFYELAHHIINTKQLLCSSCQGLYVDTEDISDIYELSERFLHILNQVANNYPKPGLGIRSQITLLLYNQELEANKLGRKIYRKDNCSIIASRDHKLETSFTYGNLWVKPLPRKIIIPSLHKYKGYLQTVGLLCGDEEREELSELLLRAGATRITGCGEMSRMICGEAHDGDYPLQRYTKLVEYTK